MKRRVVITGVGPVAACGIGKVAFRESLRAGISPIKRLSAFDVPGCKALHCAEVDNWDPRQFFPPHRLKRLDRYAQFSVASAVLALEDAGITWSREKPNTRIGVSFGTALAGISNAEIEHAKFIASGTRHVTPTLALQVFGGSAHSNIAMECGLRGVGTTNSNSCASGVISVGEGYRYIRDNFAEVIVAGGAESPLSPLTFAAFDLIKTMSRWSGEPPGRACRPFDADRDGFVMGEGGCSVILEELEHARRRGAKIYGEVLGYSLNNDAYHMTGTLPDGDRVIACMRAAMEEANVTPDQIGYINAHASSTQLNDANEAMCIRNVFGERATRECENALYVSGTKPFTGHPFGATGAMETAICALALDEGWLPPTLHHQTPDPAFELNVIPNVGIHRKVQYLLNNAFGFGGINATIVMGAVRHL